MSFFLINKSSYTLIFLKKNIKTILFSVFSNKIILFYKMIMIDFKKGLWVFFLINKSSYTLLRIFWKYEYNLI